MLAKVAPIYIDTPYVVNFHNHYGAEKTAEMLYNNVDERDIVSNNWFNLDGVARHYYKLTHNQTLLWNSVIFAIAGLTVGYLLTRK